MLSEFRDIESRDPKTMARITQTIHHLLRHQFLHIGDRGSPSLLETLRRAATVKPIEQFFDTAGYRLVIRESEGWAGIFPDVERVGHPRMGINETLVLLVLTRQWQEGVQDGDIGDYGTVLTTLNDSYDAYVDLVSRSRRQALRIEEYRDAVQELGRRAVVKLHAFDDEGQDQELVIRPIVSLLAGEEFLASLEGFLRLNPVPANEAPAGEQSRDRLP
ncbi:DUF4194 domain-containing protein [Mesorhizobium tamadayense]|uniref:DUF4194 domain-containing protein n=1 Tax=Mesorhizobium tamadayense TaxID=425306 RepID=A0A3P3FDY6_9HYPH|nr:DUF4194 domain-containing protein [Mesorhizobium tamadayense]RRH96899.1 DUF4194 domain-containing protein [Mesorhizobium tamadayense]